MYETLRNSFTNLIDKLEGWFNAFVVSLPNIILAGIVLLMGAWLSRLVKQNLQKILGKFMKDRNVINLLSSAGSVATVFIVLFVTLGILNLNQALTSILAGAGIAGLAVGMALQEPLMNTFSGVILNMRKFNNIGDWIATNGYEGKIKKISLRYTELQQPSGEKIILPNKLIVNKPLENFSIAGRRRVSVECGVGYESNLINVKNIAREAISKKFDYIENLDDVEFYYTEFGGSSINFVVRFWMCTQSLIEYKAAKSEAIVALKMAFDQDSINIPFPIRTLDFKNPNILREMNTIQPEQAKGAAKRSDQSKSKVRMNSVSEEQAN